MKTMITFKVSQKCRWCGKRFRADWSKAGRPQETCGIDCAIARKNAKAKIWRRENPEKWKALQDKHKKIRKLKRAELKVWARGVLK